MVQRPQKNKHFGATIHALRNQKGMSLREFARQVGISAAFISKMEHRESSTPKAENVEKMASILGVDADALLELAGRVDHHSVEILKQRRKVMQSLLQTANKLSDKSLMRYQMEMEKHAQEPRPVT